MLKNYRELASCVEELGFLPLFRCELRGFSVEDRTPQKLWWTGEETDPWNWRQLAAQDSRLAYGKFFHGRSGFLSLECLPDFCNFRRDGYDFDALYEEGLASRRLKAVMDQFSSQEVRASNRLKHDGGFGGREGLKGFDTVLTELQMRTYLTVRDFVRRKNRMGEEYGWPVGQYSTMEAKFGELPRAAYEKDPAESGEALFRRVRRALKEPYDQDIWKFLHR